MDPLKQGSPTCGPRVLTVPLAQALLQALMAPRAAAPQMSQAHMHAHARTHAPAPPTKSSPLSPLRAANPEKLGNFAFKGTYNLILKF